VARLAAASLKDRGYLPPRRHGVTPV